MRFKRYLAVLMTTLLGASLLALAPPVTAAPMDFWDVTHGIDCVGDRFNPIRPDGTRDPDGDPVPGTPEWTERDDERLDCTRQRDFDRRYHPSNLTNSSRYGEDWYRQPHRFDGKRWRYTYMPSGTAAGATGAAVGIPGVPAAEIFRPCAPGTCGSLPAGLERFEPPYPVVVIFHGFIAQMTHHRFNAQVYAENGYMAITVNGIHPATGAPNVQSAGNGDAVLNWLASEDAGVFGQEADLSRVAFAGHSQGSAAALSYQNDPRVHAIVAWDGGDSVSANNCTVNEGGERRPCAPIMYQRTDGAFSAPQTGPRSSYPGTRNRGLNTYNQHQARGMDVMHLTFRATSHIDWNGNGVSSLAGNRLAELSINYYTLGWLDRHLKGKLVVDDDDNVVTSGGRSEAGERAFRQAQAQRAFDRLTALRFPEGSIDKHQVSQGFYDPVQHAQSGDPLYGGNVPYTVEGLWTTDRLSPEFRSFCSVSVPDYVGDSDGTPGSPAAARADSGGIIDDSDPENPVYGDMRLTGCRQLS